MNVQQKRRQKAPKHIARAVASVLETLEPRQLLAASDPLINEFVASNGSGLLDDSSPAKRSDWIEIFNPSAAPVNLAGWHLTDSKSQPAKWTFPSGTSGTTIGAGGYLVVFADGSVNSVGPGGKLHANFSLDNNGEYLAITKPDNSVVNSFDPFPKQLVNVSYGNAPTSISTSTVIAPGAPAEVFIPANGSLGSTWTSTGFDDSSWTSGNTGVGFENSSTTGFNTHMIDTNSGSIANINTATTLLNGTLTGFGINYDGSFNDPNINYGDSGNIAGHRRLPIENANNVDYANNAAQREQYALRMTSNVFIPQGTWTIDVGSDAGFRLTLGTPGTVTFANRSGENFPTGVTNPSPSNVLVFGGTRTTGHTSATITVGPGGLNTTLQLDYFEQTGADYLELAVASGIKSFTSSNASSFSLMANGVSPPGGSGTFGVTSATAPQYTGLIGTNVSQMQNVNASAYVRVPFTVDDLTNLSAVTLNMKYDDGYVAYLNGVEVARKNAGGTVGTPLAFNAAATSDRSNGLATVFESVDLTSFANLLVTGNNVLAIQALNSSASDSDLLMVPKLDLTYSTPPVLTYMTTPTPGAANVAGSLGVAADTNFSVDDGYYTDPFDVIISSKQSDTTIYYTLDGRSPLNANGSISATAIKYTGPIHVAGTTTLRAVDTAAGYVNSDVDTQTYLFAAQIVNQTDAGNVAGFPTQWIDSTGAVVSFPTSGQAKYGMTPTVVSKYSSEIVNDLESLPAISIVMNPDDLFGTGAIKGIYSNSNTGDDGTGLWERAMSAEMIFPDGTQGFQINGGVQVQGGGSRIPANTPKHSLRLVFKTQYGAPQLDYKVFDDSDETQFDSLILKAQYNNTWVHSDPAQRNRAQYVEDQWASDVEGEMGDPTKHGRYVQLYLNGVYWGLYSLTEHPNDAWAASTMGGNKDDYDIYDNESVLISGNSSAFNTMFSLANTMITQAGQGQSTDSTFQQLEQYLDVPSFIDFMILNQYDGNQDWDVHNYYAVRHSRNDGVATNQFGGFRYLAFDSERILEGETQDVTTLNTANGPSRLYQALKTNAEFRMQFADRVHQLMFDGGPLTAATAQALYVQETAKVYPALATEEARWGTYRKDYQGSTTTAYSRNGQWQTEFNRLTVFDSSYGGANTGYFSVRGNELLKQYRDSSNLIYPAFDAAEWNQFGGNVTAGFKLTVANLAALPAGAILYYTTDGSDPRLVGGAIAPGALVYPGNATGIIINASEKIFMRVYVPSTSTWSASTVATFFATSAPKLRITEVMYNPNPPAVTVYAKDDYEFIELENTGLTPIDPSGIQFTNGISFTFPAGSPLIPVGGRIVLVRNPSAFESRYGSGIAIAGTYTDELADSGEQITLATGLGQEIESFTYSDGWFGQTDGEGFALVANDPDASDATLSTKEGWRSGEPVNGNPGGADPGLSSNSVVINELMANASDGANWVEIKNLTGAPIDISGWYLSDDSTNRQKYVIPAGTIMAANGFFSISQIGGFGSAFALSALGGSIYLTSSDGGGIGGYRDSENYGASDPGVSQGLYVKSTGGTDFVALSTSTRDADNAYPTVGPVVINEIMYDPFGLDREYIELRNITDSPVSLAGWTFSDGINFTFGPNDVIPADGYALVVPIDPAVYRTTYNVPAGAVIFGPFTGALNNGGEKITLSRPGAPVGQVTPLIVVDHVNYDNNAPWPSSPEGTGPSVGRIDSIKYGNDPINWKPDSLDGTGGVANSFSPQVFSSIFTYGAGPTVTIKFSKDVGASLVNGDLSIMNLTTGLPVDPQLVTFAYNAANQTATWQLPATLADGNYRATLLAANVTDAQNRTLDGNGDGVGGDNFSYDFFHLAGDANHDRSVGFADLVAVAQNYGSTGTTWAQGDFNFDGTVDFADLVAVAQHYGQSLAPAPAAPVPPSQAVEVESPSAVPVASLAAVAAPVTAVASVPVVTAASVNAETKKNKSGGSAPVKVQKPVLVKPAPSPVDRSVKVSGAVASKGALVGTVAPPSVFATVGKKKIADQVFG